MKKLLILVPILLIGFLARSQTYGGQIKAKSNPGVIGDINRTNDQLKVSDSLSQIRLGTLAAAVTSNKVQVDVITMPSTTVTATNLSTNIAQINGVTPLMGAGNTGTGSLRVTVATDQAALPVTGTFWQATQPVSGTVAVTNAGTFVVQENGAALTALQLIDDNMVAQSTALGSTKNALIGGSVTTAAPTYTTGNINPLSLQTDGSLRVAVTSAPSTTVTATNLSTNVAQINGVTPLMGAGNTGTGSLRVTIATDQATVPVSLASVPSHAVTNAGTFVVQENGAALTALQLIDDNMVAQGTALGATKNALIGGSVTTAAPSYTTGNINPLSLTTAGALRVDNSANTQPISGTVTINAIPAGTNNIGDVDVLTVPTDPFGANADAASATGSISAKLRFIAATGIPVTSLPSVTIGTFPDNEPFNVAQINGVTPLMGNGTTGTGSQRVTLASDMTAISTTGYMSVKLDQTTPGTTNGISLVPTTTGGLTTYHLVTAASTNATSVKASAGQLYGYYIFNANAAARKIAFHNTSGTPTAGASVFFSVVIPASSGANVEFSQGIPFSSGIGITTVTGTADSDATGVASGDLIINLFYK